MEESELRDPGVASGKMKRFKKGKDFRDLARDRMAGFGAEHTAN